MAEALALRWAITEALRLELNTLVIETDSMEVISCFLGKKESVVLDSIIQDCRAFAVNFNSFHLSHVRRGGNNVAHTLAAMTSEFPNLCWWDNFLVFLHWPLLADVFSVVI